MTGVTFPGIKWLVGTYLLFAVAADVAIRTHSPRSRNSCSTGTAWTRYPLTCPGARDGPCAAQSASYRRSCRSSYRAGNESDSDGCGSRMWQTDSPHWIGTLDIPAEWPRPLRSHWHFGRSCFALLRWLHLHRNLLPWIWMTTVHHGEGFLV